MTGCSGRGRRASATGRVCVAPFIASLAAAWRNLARCLIYTLGAIILVTSSSANAQTLTIAKQVANGDGVSQFTISGPAPVNTQLFTSPNGNNTTAAAGPFTLTAATQVTLIELTPLPAGWTS